ncbi:MAG: GTP 3',8-cyclase MoaA [Candidatus Pelagibacter sp. TMED64]|nr:GTP 3',8-cyclase MoaA [Candidatus Pelagibacter sp.]OUU65946.1 MAG: GTP 3',8-cyclase MoaA [Candidatus Pelagibacter sp. TMED64]
MLIDSFQRKISYLRVSVTDRCDFRCNYCMPEDMDFLSKKDVLSLEELNRICNTFIELGVKKLRITGGEPLVRKNIMQLFYNLGNKLGNELEELSLTTNGSQLEKYAKDLFKSGVRRINVSLDSLEKNKFKKITRFGDLNKVIKGIMTAKNVGLKVKINTVALKGINDDEILDLIDWCGKNKFSLTFIEVMPMGEIGEKRLDQYMPLTDVKKLIQTKYSITKDSLKTAGPATYVHCHETDQKIGFITPHTHNFCELCNRVRITCTGEMYMCLGQQDKADLKKPIRQSENNQALKETIYEAIKRKPKGHDFSISREKEKEYVPRHMSVTGG